MIKYLIIILIHIPIVFYMPWIINAWGHSPLDKDGPFWVLVVIVGFLLNYPNFRKSSKEKDYVAFVLISASLIFLLGGIYLNINIIAIGAAIFLSLSFVWLFFGWQVFLICLPLYLILCMSLPTSTYILWYVLGKIGLSNYLTALYAKILIASVLVITGWIYSWQKTYKLTRVNCIYWCSFVLFLALLVFSYIPSSSSLPFYINLNTDPKDNWFGDRSHLDGIEENLFNEVNADKYKFYREDGYEISVINFKAQTSNIHSIHPPDYCLRGAGWSIEEDSSAIVIINHNKYLVRKIIASLQNYKILLYSWYTSEYESTNDYKVFRIVQKRSASADWQSYLVSINIVTSEWEAEKTLKDFIRSRYLK